MGNPVYISATIAYMINVYRMNYFFDSAKDSIEETIQRTGSTVSIHDMMSHFMLIGFTPIIWSLTAGFIIDQVSRIWKSELAGLTVLCFLSSGFHFSPKGKNGVGLRELNRRY